LSGHYSAKESLLALVVENCLPINLYNKILDRARYAHFTEYNFSAAPPIYVTALRRMQDKYAQRLGGPPISDIVVVDGYQPIHSYPYLRRL
jgi:hypothetical protein